MRARMISLRDAATLEKARKLHGRRTFRGLDISVENRAGSKRHWYDPHAKREGTTTMQHDYGYIRRTRGTDGDHVDVYVGPHEDAPHVYVVTQLKAPKFDRVDEQKCMLGFMSLHEARNAYLAHYDDPRFLGGIEQIRFEDFAAEVLDPTNHGKLVQGEPMKLVRSFGAGVEGGARIGTTQGSSYYNTENAMPDMRLWQQPKSDEKKERERKAAQRRRRAMARWARGTLGLHGEPPIRYLRYEHQFMIPLGDTKASLANRAPQQPADPISLKRKP